MFWGNCTDFDDVDVLICTETGTDSEYSLPRSNNLRCRRQTLHREAGYEMLTKPGPFSQTVLHGFKTALIYNWCTKLHAHHKYKITGGSSLCLSRL